MVPVKQLGPVLRLSQWPAVCGYGINALTGSASRKPALTRSTQRQYEEARVSDEHELYVIRGADDAKRVMGYAAGDTLNVNPASWDEHYDPNAYLLHVLRCSQTSFSIVISRRRVWYSSPVGLAFTKEAGRHFQTDPERFRELYGHYYVRGLQRVDSFTAVLSFSFQRSEDRDAYAQAVQCLEGRVKGGVLDHQILHSGLPSLATAYVIERVGGETSAGYLRVDSVEELLPALSGDMDRFARALLSRGAGPVDFLVLRRYRSLPLREAAGAAPFREIDAIRDALVRTRLVINALPCAGPSPTRRLRADWCSYNNVAAELVTNATHRLSLLQDIQALESRAHAVDAVHAFWLRVCDMRAAEPAVGEAHGAPADVTWTFGLGLADATPLVKVSVSVAKTVTVLPRCLAGTRCKTLRLASRPRERVVGWRIRSLSGCGTWWNAGSGPLITERDGVIAFERGKVRPSRWEVMTFVVRENPEFEDFCWLGSRYGNVW